ncbi:MAG: NAD(P)H-binding protein [Bacteroidetes bacterium]|nr:NAD(P)H-binding protein [Bacteroidota bacterium]MBS1930273.1 NAD(P)H-binding protein [Bacteroidota bacterium]
MAKTATLIGASGLIGNHLLQLLLDDPYFDTVKILVRRKLQTNHQKLEQKIVDFNDNDSLLVAMDNSDIVFCTVGTTQKKVKGDKEVYRKIDYDIPVKMARFCKMTGCESFILVSSAGANSRSKNFYLNLKGEVEEAIQTTGIRSVYVMRPSMLMGNRKEYRFGEKVITPAMNAISFLLPSKYKPIQAEDVAKAMLASSKQNTEGFFIWEYNAMMKYKNL